MFFLTLAEQSVYFWLSLFICPGNYLFKVCKKRAEKCIKYLLLLLQAIDVIFAKRSLHIYIHEVRQNMPELCEKNGE